MRAFYRNHANPETTVLGPIPFTKRIVRLTLGGEDAFNPILALRGEAHKVLARL